MSCTVFCVSVDLLIVRPKNISFVDELLFKRQKDIRNVYVWASSPKAACRIGLQQVASQGLHGVTASATTSSIRLSHNGLFESIIGLPEEIKDALRNKTFKEENAPLFFDLRDLGKRFSLVTAA